MAAKRRLMLNGQPHEVEFEERGGTLFARLDGGEWKPVRLETVSGEGDKIYTLFIGDRPYAFAASTQPDGVVITLGGRRYEVITEQRRGRATGGHEPLAEETPGGPTTIRSTMTGVVADVLVQVGAVVQPGQTLLVIEAMKMQNELHSPRGGTIAAVYVSKGDRIDRGTPLLVLD